MIETLSVELEGGNALAALGHLPEALKDNLVGATWWATLLIERETKERTPTGVNGLARNSISSQEPVVSDESVMGSVGSSLSYIVPLELGSKPHSAPVEPLQLWAAHKLGLGQKEAEAVGWAVWRKIKRDGTKGVFMFRAGRDAAWPQIIPKYDQTIAVTLQQLESQA